MATSADPVNPTLNARDFVNDFLDAHIDQFRDGLAAADAIEQRAEAYAASIGGRLTTGDRVNLGIAAVSAFNTRRFPRSVQ